MAGPLNSKQIPVVWVCSYGICSFVLCQHGLLLLFTLKFARLESVLQTPSYILLLSTFKLSGHRVAKVIALFF